jgi:hypothetical protein
MYPAAILVNDLVKLDTVVIQDLGDCLGSSQCVTEACARHIECPTVHV